MLDLIIRNAVIRTGDVRRPAATAIGIWHGRVFGLDEDISGMRAHEEVDARGAFVMAGFNDAHAHSVWFGQTLFEIDLSTAATPEDVYRRIRAEASAAVDGESWSFASQFDPLRMTGSLDRAALDDAAGGRPLLIKHASGHAYTLNGIGLRALGLERGRVPSVVGGAVAIDAEGSPTGLLEENAMTLAATVLQPQPVDAIGRFLTAAHRRYAAEGVTSVTDAGICGGWIGNGSREFLAYQEARESGALTSRTQVMFAEDVLHDLPGHASESAFSTLDGGIRTGLGDEHLSIGPTKMFLDGSLLGKTAAMSDHYCGGTHGGYLTADAETLRDRALRAAGAGWSLAMHAIGDHGIDQALDIAEAALRLRAPRVPHRIEHGGFVRQDQLVRMARLGVFLVPQPGFIPAFGDGMAAALGPDRVRSSYPGASVLASGMHLPASSDRPVAPGAPLTVIQAAVERITESGMPYAPDERISVDQALTAYTAGSAAVTGSASVKGRLQQGALADLVVLAEDPRRVSTSVIHAIPVLATYVGGVRVL